VAGKKYGASLWEALASIFRKINISLGEANEKKHMYSIGDYHNF